MGGGGGSTRLERNCAGPSTAAIGPRSTTIWPPGHYQFNTRRLELMKLSNVMAAQLRRRRALWRSKPLSALVILLAPFAPNLAEELWPTGWGWVMASVHRPSAGPCRSTAPDPGHGCNW